MARSRSSPLEFKGLPAPTVYVVRGSPVVMDEDVARFFGVETRRLNEQVSRNTDKFGEDFAFHLDAEEYADLKSQIATSSGSGHGGRRKPPRMFTEHGVVMAATVLTTEQAVAASRFIIKVFVEARRNQLAAARGRNSPAAIDPRVVLPLAADSRHGLTAKLDAALNRVLDAIADPSLHKRARSEARAIISEGLDAIKEHLRRPGAQNEKTLAEVRKLIGEAEGLDAEIAGRHIENEHRQLALLAKQLRMVIEVQRYLETGSVQGLLAVLKDLGGD